MPLPGQDAHDHASVLSDYLLELDTAAPSPRASRHRLRQPDHLASIHPEQRSESQYAAAQPPAALALLASE
jgi:hypothetical protein